jgi:hypothetical protein
VGEAEREEAFEIDRCAAVGPGEPVAVGAAVAESPVAVGDEPGDGAFDHGPVLVEPVGLGLAAGRGEQVVVGVQIDDPPAGRGGAQVPGICGSRRRSGRRRPG